MRPENLQLRQVLFNVLSWSFANMHMKDSRDSVFYFLFFWFCLVVAWRQRSNGGTANISNVEGSLRFFIPALSPSPLVFTIP
jgi:hypothetical protein